ncbi:MAG TPA: DinB family protein [Pyrinomonadaceae bacterium]|nr:DinB family protein [Pyrinomonadaceae bacterium]
MSDQAIIELFKKELFQCLDETFEQVRGIYLDRGTSLFETLEGISAEDASRPIAENCATVAAQVEHVRFYLDVLNDVMQKEEVTKVDWREIWQNVREVTPEEWEGQKRRLRESYQRVLATLKSDERWQGEYGISGALAVLTHTAYHLGGIRQALCAIRSAKE